MTSNESDWEKDSDHRIMNIVAGFPQSRQLTYNQLYQTKHSPVKVPDNRRPIATGTDQDTEGFANMEARDGIRVTEETKSPIEYL